MGKQGAGTSGTLTLSLRLIVTIILLTGSSPAASRARFLSRLTRPWRADDESSLLALKAHIMSTNNNVLLAKNWSSSQGVASYCTWVGVTCSRKHKTRVVALNLSNMALQGTIPPLIGNLSFLRYLDITNNNFGGPIPSEIANLSRLRVLHMNSNQLEGHIPPSLGSLSNLEMLNISDNSLTGTIPGAIFNISSLRSIWLRKNLLSGTLPDNMCHHLSQLRILNLGDNELGGDIPTSLSRCAQLRFLYLSFNNLTGAIHVQIGNLSQLYVIALAQNMLTGSIPISISNLSNLKVLDLGANNLEGTTPGLGRLFNLEVLSLGHNRLNGEIPQYIFNLSTLRVISLSNSMNSGELPAFIGERLPNLEGLYLHEINITGTIPNSISNLTNLRVLGLEGNSLRGLLPSNLGNLRQLEILIVTGNMLSNDLSIPEQDFLTPLIRNCKNLRWISFDANPITGTLPKSIGDPSSNLSTALEKFTASDCRIRGEIPHAIGNLSSLLLLTLKRNELNGEIPVSLTSLRKLQVLQISKNNLHGSIPDVVFCSLENLFHLDLSENRLSGHLPNCIGSLSSLRKINLDKNALNSTIPSSFWFNDRILTISLSFNLFHGSLPQDISNMRSMTWLYLDGNQLSGEIPKSIGYLGNLINASLSDNKLTGPIPESFADLKTLQMLDLSHNNLSGEIPKSLATLEDLQYFNVSFNELTGEIPTGGPFRNLTSDSFMGNRGLCGDSRFKVEVCKNNTPNHSDNKSRILRYILPPAAAALVIATMILMFLRYRDRKSSSFSLSGSSFGLALKRISYHEILRATSNLDEVNLIGRGSIGSVYKGILEGGVVAAIKIFDLHIQGAHESFDKECQVIRSIRHRNLIKAITSCSNLDFKALVMEYIPNGNLDKWLHSSDRTLNMVQRLRIMVDVASAIEYLHNEISPSAVVHCDLKPSNILLDNDMVARVGDFGIAKLLTQEQRMAQTKTLGTIGYMAPEYGSAGLVSTTVDVYSFGILLMETFTGERPTDEIFSGELTIRKWVSESMNPNTLEQIVDARLLDVDGPNVAKHASCLASIMGLALECTTDLPEERINMKDVVVRLKKIDIELHLV